MGGGGGAVAADGRPARGPPPGANARARVYVGSVPFAVSSLQLRAMFESFGAVKSCELLPPTEKTAGHPHRGYGFVEFEVRCGGAKWG